MKDVVALVLGLVICAFRGRGALLAENLALRHQLVVYQRGIKRAAIRPADRLLWCFLSRVWRDWTQALVFVKPATVIGWQRRRFRTHWAKLSRGRGPGRPTVPDEVRQLVRTMSEMNPTWGSPRIVGELAKIGIEVSKSTVERYMARRRGPASQTWKAFLGNHSRDIVSIDFLVVPTVRFKVLYVLVVLSIERRRIVHFGVSEHPTAAWAAQQIAEAFPWDGAPRFLLRDRDAIYGEGFRRRVKSMGIDEILTAPRSPWQNAYSERLNGSIRRECLDHVLVFNRDQLRRVLKSYECYYNRCRTHLSLDMDSPQSRRRQNRDEGRVVAIAQVGGLHHLYERVAA